MHPGELLTALQKAAQLTLLYGKQKSPKHLASSSGAAGVGNGQRGDHRGESVPQDPTGAAGEDDFDLQNASPSQSFTALDPNDPKDRVQAAQKRLRTRQKERTRTQQKQLEELTGKMKELMQEKAALTTRKKILAAVVVLNTRHQERLHANQERMQREHCMLMGELAPFVNALEQRSDLKGSTVEQWTMGQYMDHVSPRYIARCKALLSKGGEAAQQEIDSLVCMRRELEERSSLEAVPPPTAIWQAILEGLKLSEQQEDFIVSARKEMIERLHEIADERRSILSSVAMLVVQSSPEVWQASLEMQQLQRSLGQERLAVHTFLFTVCQAVLTTQQEALLDAAAYPWWPDMWHISCLLSQRHKVTEEAKRAPAAKRQTMAAGSAASAADGPMTNDQPDLGINIPVLKSSSLLPHTAAFECLAQPLLARGAGLRLDCDLVIDPFQTVLPAAACSIPAIAQLRGMGLLDVHCRCFFPVMFWDWMQQHLPQLPHS
ncbi:hypothetical protein WJX73_005548 [Symbiochloris irregularis]|uniref:BZIP domain-containing protein n=1 Tax=Symbiochloris irregularis TaxID=706552 RepID=A0AAW1PJM1_9CHLO